MLHLSMCRRPCMRNDVHTCDPAGSIVCHALHLKQMNEGGSAMRSKHAPPQAKEP